MEDLNINGKTFRAAFVLILVLGITLLFLAVSWPFLKALLLGAILAGLCSPLYRWLVKLFRGRRSAASGVTLLILFFIIVGPLSAFLGLVVKQAIDVSDTAIPWVPRPCRVPIPSIPTIGWSSASPPSPTSFRPRRSSCEMSAPP